MAVGVPRATLPASPRRARPYGWSARAGDYAPSQIPAIEAMSSDPRPSAPGVSVSMSEVLSSLSRALDLTEGQPLGHTLRSCAIGMRLAERHVPNAAERSALHYALLLKDAGCSSNAARFASLFGTDDHTVKYRMKFVDWHRKVRLAIRTATTVGHDGSFLSRVSHFTRIARSRDITRELIRIRCDRGAGIARQLGFPEATAEAVRALDEHWCGAGYPDGLSGDRIPLLARIANLSQCVELYLTRYGRTAALEVARRRRGTWFDPDLVDVLMTWADDDAWWEMLDGPELLRHVVELEPPDRRRVVDEDGLDQIAMAFAEIVDAKSPYTFRHSANVAAYSRAVAGWMGMDEGEQRLIHRAGLLHDIGKLGVSSRILEKPGRLTPAEREEVERHPLFTWEILSRVSAFDTFARTAALHHEKLDGTGYPWGVRAGELDRSARILCVTDIFEAITADRPYRRGLDPEAALGIVRGQAGTALCADVCAALGELVEAGHGPGLLASACAGETSAGEPA